MPQLPRLPTPSRSAMGDRQITMGWKILKWPSMTWTIWDTSHGLEASISQISYGISIQNKITWISGKTMKSRVSMKNVDLICCGFPKRGDHRGTTGEMGLYYALACRSIFKHQVQGDCCDREPNVNYPGKAREFEKTMHTLVDQVVFSENMLKTFYLSNGCGSKWKT